MYKIIIRHTHRQVCWNPGGHRVDIINIKETIKIIIHSHDFLTYKIVNYMNTQIFELILWITACANHIMRLQFSGFQFHAPGSVTKCYHKNFFHVKNVWKFSLSVGGSIWNRFRVTTKVFVNQCLSGCLQLPSTIICQHEVTHTNSDHAYYELTSTFYFRLTLLKVLQFDW